MNKICNNHINDINNYNLSLLKNERLYELYNEISRNNNKRKINELFKEIINDNEKNIEKKNNMMLLTEEKKYKKLLLEFEQIQIKNNELIKENEELKKLLMENCENKTILNELETKNKSLNLNKDILIKQEKNNLENLSIQNNEINRKFIEQKNIIINLQNKIFKLEEECNNLLINNKKKEKEFEKIFSIKLIKEKELFELKEKNEIEKKELEINIDKLNEKLNELLNQKEELNKNLIKLNEINENLLAKLNNKIENEKMLIIDRDRYKNLLNNLNNNININMNDSFLKSEYNNGQDKNRKINNEKEDLINKMNNLENENKELSENYQKCMNKLNDKFGINKKINPKSLNDFLIQCTDELIKLNDENENLNKIINDFEYGEEIKEKNNNNNNNMSHNKKINNEYNIKKINSLKTQINDYITMNEKLKKTVNNYSHEIENKNNILDFIHYGKNQIEILNDKLKNEKNYIIDILLRIIKVFNNSEIHNLIIKIINNPNLSFSDKQNIEQKINLEIKNLKEKYSKI